MDQIKMVILGQILRSEAFQWTTYDQLHLRHLLEECLQMYQGIDILAIKDGFRVTSQYLAEEMLDNVDYFLLKCQHSVPRLKLFLTDLKQYTEQCLREVMS